MASDDDLSTTLAARIREELGRRRVTRQWLADEARIGLSTLEKALSGKRPFSTGTLVRIEEVLGLTLRAPAADNRDTGVAPEELGAYARAAVRALEGEYVTLRPSFEAPDAIYAYRTTIFWDQSKGQLGFTEHNRSDAAYSQRGDVALPHQSGHVYLVTREAGQFRLAILSRPTIDGSLYGLLTTLQAPGGSRLVPLACPLALVPAASCDAPLGLIDTDQPESSMLAAHLSRIEVEGFARLLGATSSKR